MLETETLETASRENCEWAETIATEMWLYVATQAVRHDAPTFTLPIIKNTTQFMVYHENHLRLSLEVLLRAGKVHLPADAKGRILTYTVDRELAEALVPALACEDDYDDDDDDDDDDSEEEEDDDGLGDGGGEGAKQSARGSSGGAESARRKKKRKIPKAEGARSKQPQEHTFKKPKQPNQPDTPVYVPVYRPPPKIETSACPVSDACMAALQSALSMVDGMETKTALVLELLCGDGEDGAGGGGGGDCGGGGGAADRHSRADVEAGLSYLAEINKIMLDDDDIYIL